MKKNRRCSNKFFYMVLIMMVIAVTFGQIAFAAPSTPLTDIKSQAGKAGPILCSDPSVKLVMNKVLVGSTAKITLTGTVCNAGLRDYVGTVPMDAFFMVITWHPPKTAAMESDLKVFSHNPIGNTLKKGECKTFTQVYTIPGVTKWGLTATTKTERQAIKEFTFGVDKKYPMQAGDTSFSKVENCKIDNDRASIAIEYMESPVKLPLGSGGFPDKGNLPKETHPDWLNPQPEPPIPK